jgi:hypothetical protein
MQNKVVQDAQKALDAPRQRNVVPLTKLPVGRMQMETNECATLKPRCTKKRLGLQRETNARTENVHMWCANDVLPAVELNFKGLCRGIPVDLMRDLTRKGREEM